MKATGIVRRIDELGRIVIPKEIRRTMRIREGDPLEIYTSREGEVIFKKYSMMGGVDEFASGLCDTLHKSTGLSAAVCDRDGIIAVSGSAKRELIGKRISKELEQKMDERTLFRAQGEKLPVCDTPCGFYLAVAAPIIVEGDVTGAVLFVAGEGEESSFEPEANLARAFASFLGRNMEL